MALEGTAIGDLFGPGHVLVIAKFLKQASFSKRDPTPENVLYLENIFLGGLGPMRSDSIVTRPVCISDIQC